MVKSSTLPSYRHSLTPFWSKQTTSLAFQTRPLLQQRQPGCQRHQNSYISALFSTFTRQYQTYLDYVKKKTQVWRASGLRVMTHSTWKTVPQFSSPVWKILNSRRTYSSHAEITQIMQQWLPPPTPQDESPLQLTAIYLPMIQPVKAEERRRYFRCECFSAKLGLSFCVKSPAYLTHSLIPGGGGLLGETCPVVKGRKAQLTSQRLDVCSFRTLAPYYHATASGLPGNLNRTRMQWHLPLNCNVNHWLMVCWHTITA